MTPAHFATVGPLRQDVARWDAPVGELCPMALCANGARLQWAPLSELSAGFWSLRSGASAALVGRARAFFRVAR